MRPPSGNLKVLDRILPRPLHPPHAVKVFVKYSTPMSPLPLQMGHFIVCDLLDGDDVARPVERLSLQ